jgi:two-component system cell cycle response regulator
LKTILCVDDIDANLFTLEAIIKEQNEHYKVITATSGQEALRVLLSTKIDLILLDVMMPEMDGFETARLILKNKKTKKIPILFVTAKKDDETITKCYDTGGVDYLSKPYNTVELFKRMTFHLELIEDRKKLENERNFVQNILDAQENILVVMDKKSIVKVNKGFLDFFNIANKEMFIERYGSLASTFLAKDGCFIPEGSSKDNLVDSLETALKKAQQIVAIEDPKSQSIDFFSIDVNAFNDYYLLSLTNITELNEASNAFKYSAFHDSLTGVYNRQRLNIFLSAKIRSQETFAFVMLDIDHFKSINDTYGHLVGDEILKELATLVQKSVRKNDIFARWGGEEFVILLDGVRTIEQAEKIADYIRNCILNTSFKDVEKLTCSFGVTLYKKDDSVDSLTKRVDTALYEAKEGGRNRVCTVI